MNDKKLPIRYRAAIAEDANFIFNSWLRSYRNSPFARNISNTIYFNEQHKLLEELVKTCKVVVACNESDTSQIYGYIVGDNIDGFLVIHYLYVKQSFRNMGIGKSLLNMFDHDIDKAAIYTHHTKIADRLAPRFNLIYHPYVLHTNYDFTGADNDETDEK